MSSCILTSVASTVGRTWLTLIKPEHANFTVLLQSLSCQASRPLSTLCSPMLPSSSLGLLLCPSICQMLGTAGWYLDAGIYVWFMFGSEAHGREHLTLILQRSTFHWTILQAIIGFFMLHNQYKQARLDEKDMISDQKDTVLAAISIRCKYNVHGKKQM